VVTLGRTITSAVTLWNVVHHGGHRALVRDELPVRIPISEAAADLPVVVAALVVVELDRGVA
jgi:hypothetical protein